jgi:hypothetical protein
MQDLIIVVAGLAGLALAGIGADIIVLEARDRIPEHKFAQQDGNTACKIVPRGSVILRQGRSICFQSLKRESVFKLPGN